MKRKESDQIAERNSPIVQHIKEIKAKHPSWGYRRTWAHLKFVDKLYVTKKAVNTQFPDRLSATPPHIMANNGSRPTSISFMKCCRATGKARFSSAITNPGATSLQSQYLGQGKRSYCGCKNGTAHLSWSMLFQIGSLNISAVICIQYWDTRH